MLHVALLDIYNYKHVVFSGCINKQFK